MAFAICRDRSQRRNMTQNGETTFVFRRVYKTTKKLLLASSYPSVHHSACGGGSPSAPAGRIFIKFGICGPPPENLWRKFRVY